jgi:hypothetical protein
MKQGNLFCFVCHTEISQITALHATLLVSSESSKWVGVHRLGWRLFGATVWILLIIESFSQWNPNKIETENCIGKWGNCWCCWKDLGELDLTEFVLQISELRCERSWFFSVFCCWKFKQIAEKVKNKEHVHTWANSTGYTSLKWILRSLLWYLHLLE